MLENKNSNSNWSYPPTVLMLYLPPPPPMYWTSSNALNNLHSTEPTLYGVISRLYCDVVHVISKRNKVWKRYRDSLKIRNVSDRYLHCTEQPPQYWCYPHTVLKLSPQYCWYPPLYWTTSTVLKLSPHSTEAIPPMYWATSTVV